MANLETIRTPEKKVDRPKIGVIGLGNIGRGLLEYRGDAVITALTRTPKKIEDVHGVTNSISGLDLLNPECLPSIVKKLKANNIDTVINATSYKGSMDAIELAREAGNKDAYLLHVLGTYHLAQALADADIGLIQISTDAALWQRYESEGMNRIAPISPFAVDETRVTSEYGRTKLLGERAALSAHPDAVIVRLGQVNTDTGGLMPLSLRKVLDEEELSVREDQLVSPVRVETVARALYDIEAQMTAAKREGKRLDTKVFHIAARDEISPNAIATRIEEAVKDGNTKLILPAEGKVAGQKVERPLRTSLDVDGSMPTVSEEIDLFLAKQLPVLRP